MTSRAPTAGRGRPRNFVTLGPAADTIGELMPTSDPFEHLVAELSTRFTGLPVERVDGEIAEALRRLVDVLDTDRSTLVEMLEDGRALRVTHSWAAPGIAAFPEDAAEKLPAWWAATLARGESLRLSLLPDDLPPGAEAERSYVERRGMKSHLAVPLVVGGRNLFALATAVFRGYRTWSEADVRRLRVVGQILVNALYRKRIEGELRDSLAEVRSLKERIEEENAYLRTELLETAHPDEIVGVSAALRRAVSLAAQVAPSDSSVLLLGETGTGKELFANAIHAQSRRSRGPLIKVNCAAIPATLLESELFGHEKGAFTGAIAARPGRFELADGGTLLLDEIGDLPSDVQAKLLRVLQDHEVQRLGATRSHTVDVRIVTATNRDLERRIAEGAFRQDLYYRIAVFVIRIPPLREHLEDIPLLVWSIINRRQPELDRHIERISKRSMAALQEYPWPGNVRELENVIERALILSRGPALELDESFAGGAAGAEQPRHASDTFDSVAADHIVHVLERCNWRIDGKGNAAEVLGLHPNTLRSRMKRLGIARPRKPE
jgi:formate hydrogenlyase transcriptional activator